MSADRQTARQETRQMSQHRTHASPDNGAIGHASRIIPAPEDSDCVLVGVDRGGSWVVRTISGKRGGLFVSRGAALRYAQLEFARTRSRIVMMPGNLELDVAPSRPIGRHQTR